MSRDCRRVKSRDTRAVPFGFLECKRGSPHSCSRRVKLRVSPAAQPAKIVRMLPIFSSFPFLFFFFTPPFFPFLSLYSMFLFLPSLLTRFAAFRWISKVEVSFCFFLSYACVIRASVLWQDAFSLFGRFSRNSATRAESSCHCTFISFITRCTSGSLKSIVSSTR